MEMGGRGARSSSKSSGSHSKVITAEEFVKMSGRERVRTKIALRKKVEAGTATKADRQTLKNYADAQAMRGGFKNAKAEKVYAAGSKERQKRIRKERERADKAWANLTNATYERAQKRLNDRVASFYSHLN